MDIRKTSSLSEQQKKSILQLWNNEYPAQLAFALAADFDNYLRVLSRPRHYVVLKGEYVVAWAFAFDREGERWFAIIVEGSLHKTGIGTALLDALKAENGVLNGWLTDHDRYLKANGEPYCSPKSFYAKNGFSFCEEERLETDKLSAVKIKWAAPARQHNS